MKRVAVLTSGGDAPGMNAAIRASRAPGSLGCEVFGVRHGYAGLIAGEFVPLGPRDVGGIMQRGGTILGQRALPRVPHRGRPRKALQSLAQQGIDALVVIGGNGSQSVPHALSQVGFPVVGVASTIDNDLFGSDMTIGVDTALNIALEAIDRLKVTASSHQRAFLVEVMGRDCGYLALMVGHRRRRRGHRVPEIRRTPRRSPPRSWPPTSAASRTPWWSWPRARTTTPRRWRSTSRSTRAAGLRPARVHARPRAARRRAHVADRMLATRLGAAAVEHLARGQHGVLVGMDPRRRCGPPRWRKW